MRVKACLVLALAAFSLAAAEIPRKSPDFAIQLENGKQIKVSDYHGKVLCVVFILTTCPHCQKTTQLLSGIYRDLGPKGLEVVEAAVNEGADVPAFIQQFQPPFPVGTAGALAALDYMQWPKEKRPLVPFVVFIDKQGMIRSQYTGVDEAFFDDHQEQHLRDEISKLMMERVAHGKTTAVK